MSISLFKLNFVMPVVHFWYLSLSVLKYLLFQGRQKLARFSAHEFATLVIDILTDAKRRQWGNSCESPKGIIRCFLFLF